MAMSKKDFIALADSVRVTKPRPVSEDSPSHSEYKAQLAQWMDMRDELANFCASQNPRFKRERWLGYIAGTNGPNGGVR